MKVKLLKKIRKRYEITKVEDIGTDPSWRYKTASKKYGLPFYGIYDNEDSNCTEFFADEELDKAIEKIREWIRSEYTHKIKGRKGKYKKAWHV